jgi:site-specific DNA-methyltransferase (adenine-specific)
MERILKAGSNESDLVADFFCGCGTTIAVAEKLKRKWLGVDISHLAVRLIAKRLVDSYGDEVEKTFEIHGFPKDLDSARELANKVKGGRLEFEDWIIEVMLHGIMNERRNEMGFDGYRTFALDRKYLVMLEVKSGNATPTQLNHFIMTVKDKKGDMGVFICFAEQITRNMQLIAKKEGLFTDDNGNTYSDKIQIISVEELLEGKRPQIPQSKFETFKKAEKKSTDTNTQTKFDL